MHALAAAAIGIAVGTFVALFIMILIAIGNE